MDDYMSAMAVDRPKMLRLWTWEDSSKIVAFLNINIMKSKQYGLDMPHQNSRLQTKEELKQKEDELTEYFLQEMRKPAASWSIQGANWTWNLYQRKPNTSNSSFLAWISTINFSYGENKSQILVGIQSSQYLFI